MSLPLTEDSVKDVFVQFKGKITNKELINHFQSHFVDTSSREEAKKEFKKIVNKLAAVKEENGQKFLVLKSQYKHELALERVPNADGFSRSILEAISALDVRRQLQLQEEDSHKANQPELTFDESDYHQPSEQNSSKAHIETEFPADDTDPVTTSFVDESSEEIPSTDTAVLPMEPISKSNVYQTKSLPTSSVSVGDVQMEHSEATQFSREESPTASQATTVSSAQSSVSLNVDSDSGVFLAPTHSAGKSAGTVKLTVKERARRFVNDDGDFRTPVNTRGRQSKQDSKSDDTSSIASVSLNDFERNWLLISSACDYHAMAKTLLSHPELANFRNFMNGFTALHYAAAAGKIELIKLLAGKYGAEVNRKSNGGYTPLILAAQHNHRNVMCLLLEVYHAKNDIRDNSGKMASSYLENRLNTSLVTTKQVFLDRTNQQSTGVKTFGAKVYPGNNYLLSGVRKGRDPVMGVHVDKPPKKSGFVRDQLRKTALLLTPAAVEEKLRKVANSPLSEQKTPKGKLETIRAGGSGGKVKRSISAAAEILPDLVQFRANLRRGHNRFGSVRNETLTEGLQFSSNADESPSKSFGSNLSLNVPKSTGTIV